MNGMSLVMSKPCCPMYNFGRSNKMDYLIPRRFSSNLLHFQGISTPVAATTRRMLKHQRANTTILSAFRDVKGDSRSQVPEVSGVEVSYPYVLLGAAAAIIIGIALAKNWEVVAQSISTIGGFLKSDACYYIFIVVASVSATGSAFFLGKILDGTSLAHHEKFISIGDIIQVGSVEGQITEIGLIATSFLSTENVPMLLANHSLTSIINISDSWCEMKSKIFVQADEIDKNKIHEISEEIINMMKSNSNVYSAKYAFVNRDPPYCYPSKWEGCCAELTLGCDLKYKCEDELQLAKHDVLLQSVQIIKKHGLRLSEHTGEIKGL